MAEVASASTSSTGFHTLYDKWTLWAHLPHDTDWSLKSYKKIIEMSNVEQAVTLTETLPDKLIKNCMLFIMRSGIQPTWEDESNANGGCFSYKITNKFVKEVWTRLSYCLMGETLTKNKDIHNIINGITISPKKNFCIIKIWTNTCEYQDANIIENISQYVSSHGCLFKKHVN